jgi:large subunit ribosomal protein L2
MGKRIIPQRRGRGTSTYRAHSFRYAGKTSYNTYNKNGLIEGKVIDLVHSKGHSAPLLKVKYTDGKEALIPSFVGAYIGKDLVINQKEEVDKEELNVGSAYLIKNIPEGSNVFNIELTPGDSGKLVKAGGSFATVISHVKGMTKIALPSKKEKLVLGNCRAFLGEIGGGGRLEKPFLKAGNKFHEMKKKNKLYPRVSGVAMSAYDHPHGSTRSLRKGRPTIAPRNAPPGRKVGMLRPRHTGRNK